MNNKFFIKTCPTCGSDKIQLVVKDIIRKYQDQTYTVPSVEFYICSNCGEKVYDKTAIQKVEEFSPAYHHKHALADTE
jgi:YgiT-type zinc finger domain-containing protein